MTPTWNCLSTVHSRSSPVALVLVLSIRWTWMMKTKAALPVTGSVRGSSRGTDTRHADRSRTSPSSSAAVSSSSAHAPVMSYAGLSGSGSGLPSMAPGPSTSLRILLSFPRSCFVLGNLDKGNIN